MYTHERAVTWSRGLCESLHTHTALTTIVSGPCRWASSLQLLINPIDLSQGSKVTVCIDGRKCFMQQGQAWFQTDRWRLSHVHHTCIYLPPNKTIWAFYYPICLDMKPGAAHPAPRLQSGCGLSRCECCSGHVHWCSGLAWVKGSRLSAQLHTRTYSHTPPHAQTSNQSHMRMCDWSSAPTRNPCLYWSTWNHADVYEENEDHQ